MARGMRDGVMERVRTIGCQIESERLRRVGREEEGAPVRRILKSVREVTVLELRDVVVGGLVQQVLLEGIHAGQRLPREQHRLIVRILQIHSHQIILRHSIAFAGFLNNLIPHPKPTKTYQNSRKSIVFHILTVLNSLDPKRVIYGSWRKMNIHEKMRIRHS